MAHTGLPGLPAKAEALTRQQQKALKSALTARILPDALQPSWAVLCQAVAAESALRWARAMRTPRDRLRLLWRLLRVSSATYFVLGTDKTASLRLRVDSAWDWMHAYELRMLTVAPRRHGQPEVAWQAVVNPRAGGTDLRINGHVEVRWSHGRFVGFPEAKVYLDTPHVEVPGYHPLD